MPFSCKSCEITSLSSRHFSSTHRLAKSNKWRNNNLGRFQVADFSFLKRACYSLSNNSTFYSIMSSGKSPKKTFIISISFRRQQRHSDPIRCRVGSDESRVLEITIGWKVIGRQLHCHLNKEENSFELQSVCRTCCWNWLETFFWFISAALFLQVGNEKKEQHMLYTFLNEEKVSFNEYIEVMNTGRTR